MTNTVDFVAPVPSQDVVDAGAAAWSRWATMALALGVTLVYLPSALGAGFLAFDDNFFFGPDNPEFREGLVAVFDPGRPIANAWLPVAHFSLWLDWWLFEAQPLAPHLHSLLMHALSGFVLVRLLLRLAVPSLPAHLVGALFLLHPALAESVVWVSGRKELLAGLFVLLALHQTVRYAAVGGVLRVGVVVLCGALAMYAKATAVVLPLLALLVCLASGGRRSRFWIVALLLVVTALIAWHHRTIAVAEGTMLAGDIAERWRQVPGVLLHYLYTTVWPVDLNVLYPEVQTLERFRAVFVPASAAIGGLLAVALLMLRSRALRLAGGGLLAFFVALLPFNTAFPASSVAAADRYLYFAVPAMALAAVVVAWRWFGRGGLAALALALLPFAYLTGSRAQQLCDTETLWRASLAVEDDNAVAHFNLATELMRRAPLPLEEVREHLMAAVRSARYPIHELRARRVLLAIELGLADYEAAAGHARAAITAAQAQLARETGGPRRRQAESLLIDAHLAAFEPLRLVGDEAAAAQSHARAVEVVPDHPEVVAFSSLLALSEVADELREQAAVGGSAQLAVGDPRGEAADRALRAALEAHPDHPSLLFAQASWDRARGDALAALRHYRRAQAVAPDRVDAWLGAARLLRERESYEDAARYASDGLRHRDDPALRQEWALALVGSGRLDDAILQLEACLQLRPHDVDLARILANVLIGRAYARLSEPGASHEEVLRIVDRALALNPKEGKAHLVLGRIAREQRMFAKAVEHLETAYALLPEYEDARSLLTDSLRDLGFECLLRRDDLVAAGDAWLRCLAVAPEEAELQGVELQLAALWRRHKEAGLRLLAAKEHAGAVAEFRRCLRIDPDPHAISWPLAYALHDQPDVDLAELEQLCRQAVAWQDRHGVEASEQVYLLAMTLLRRERPEAARKVAAEWVERASDEARPQVVAELRRLSGL